MGGKQHYNQEEINRDSCWERGDSVAFSSHGFPRIGFIAGVSIDGDYVGTFNFETDKPVSHELMPFFQYGKNRRVQSSPIRGEIYTARILLTEKTLWPFKFNPKFCL